MSLLNPLSHQPTLNRTPDLGLVSGLTYGTGVSAPTGPVAPGGPSMDETPMPGSRADYYDPNVQFTNAWSTRHYAQKTIDWTQGDTFAGLPTFFQRPKDAVNIPMNVSYRMFGVSQWNQEMANNPHWRKEWGNAPKWKVLRDWAYVGVQQSKQTLLRDGVQFNEENNFFVHGRVTMPNLALAIAQNACVSEGDRIYMVLRRHEYLGAAAADPATWAMPPRSDPLSMVDGASLVADTPVAKAVEAHSRKRAFQAAMATDLDGSVSLDQCVLAPAGNKQTVDLTSAGVSFEHLSNDPLSAKRAPPAGKEYFWQWHFYTSSNRSPPRVALYCDDSDPDNTYAGDFIPLGIVTHVIGPNTRSTSQVNHARKALYPDERGPAYLESLCRLNRITVQLGCGA